MDVSSDHIRFGKEIVNHYIDCNCAKMYKLYKRQVYPVYKEHIDLYSRYNGGFLAALRHKVYNRTEPRQSHIMIYDPILSHTHNFVSRKISRYLAQIITEWELYFSF